MKILHYDNINYNNQYVHELRKWKRENSVIIGFSDPNNQKDKFDKRNENGNISFGEGFDIKPWYKSKSVLTIIAAGLAGIIYLCSQIKTFPEIEYNDEPITVDFKNNKMRMMFPDIEVRHLNQSYKLNSLADSSDCKLVKNSRGEVIAVGKGTLSLQPNSGDFGPKTLAIIFSKNFGTEFPKDLYENYKSKEEISARDSMILEKSKVGSETLRLPISQHCHGANTVIRNRKGEIFKYTGDTKFFNVWDSKTLKSIR